MTRNKFYSGKRGMFDSFFETLLWIIVFMLLLFGVYYSIKKKLWA